MNWMETLGPLLQQYTRSNPSQPAPNVEEHFDQVAQAAPTSTVAEGLAAAFRSGQTPPFAQMASQLFGKLGGNQRAGVLNELLASAGPGGLSALGSLFGGQSQVTPDQAEKVPPQVVQQMAEHAEKNDPSIVDRLSQIYAEHPTAIKTLGGAALTIALAKVAERQRG